ncbi:hypothetical protein [Streptomyces sp. NPDC021224]|uniref:hypothetical protein n=1 Tax=unclassified Streptomyces TaxID=2593676 RepID=UPI00379B7C71
MRKRVGAAVIAVLSAGGLFLGSGVAQAASQDIPWTVTWDSNTGGNAKFVSLGDDLWVCDTMSGDSYGAGAVLINQNTGAIMESVYDGAPDGSCVSTNKNLPEDIPVRLQVCLFRGSDPGVYCTLSVEGRT